ncbi:MAG: transposase [Cyanobacteria bacterium P01_C01_bin.120]
MSIGTTVGFLSGSPLTDAIFGLDLSSDVGLLLVRQAVERLGVCRSLAGCIAEWRDSAKILYLLTDWVSQRVYQTDSGVRPDDSDRLSRPEY